MLRKGATEEAKSIVAEGSKEAAVSSISGLEAGYQASPFRGLGKVIGALIATLVVVGLLLVHVWSRHRVIKLGYEISELSEEREDLLEENRRLRIEYRLLTRGDRLEPLAKTRLGLAPPRPEQIIYIRADQLPLPSFDLAPAAPAPTPGPAQADLSMELGE